MKKFALVALAGVLLFSCNNNNVEEVDQSLITTPAEPSNLPASDANAETNATNDATANEAEAMSTNANNNAQAITINPATTPMQVNPAPIPAPSATTAKLNPAHGQPGHRCDIAVGAPLSSAPATPAAPASITPAPSPNISTSPVTVPTVNAPAIPAAPGVKLNPPHGEPGHDCAVQVGAPLKG